MNKVASHINEMQKIHEEYGAVFDQLIAEQTGEKKEVIWWNLRDKGCYFGACSMNVKLYQVFTFLVVSFKWILV